MPLPRICSLQRGVFRFIIGEERASKFAKGDITRGEGLVEGRFHRYLCGYKDPGLSVGPGVPCASALL